MKRNSTDTQEYIMQETKEILEHFFNKPVYHNIKHERLIFITARILPAILISLFYTIKTLEPEFLININMVYICASIYILIIIILCLYFLKNMKTLGKLESKIINDCEGQFNWSENSLLSARTIIKPLITTCERRLSVFKILCAAMAFLFTAILYNISSLSEITNKHQLLTGDLGDIIKFSIVCILVLVSTGIILNYFLLTYHIHRLSMTDISLELLIFMSHHPTHDKLNNSNDLTKNKPYLRRKRKHHNNTNKNPSHLFRSRQYRK